jgi:hypothetical protein
MREFQLIGDGYWKLRGEGEQSSAMQIEIQIQDNLSIMVLLAPAHQPERQDPYCDVQQFSVELPQSHVRGLLCEGGGALLIREALLSAEAQ